MATETTVAAHAASSAPAAAGAAVAAPVLAGLGIDLTTIGAAFVGVVVVQTLLPANRSDWRTLAGLSVGSMLFSSLGTPWVLLWARDVVPYVADLREWHSRAMVSAALGGFAQPLLLGVRALLGRWLPATPGATPGPASPGVQPGPQPGGQEGKP